MRELVRRAATIATLIFISLLPLGCTASQQKQAVQAAQDIKNSIVLADTTVTTLLSSKAITSAEAIKIQEVLLLLDRADQSFVKAAQAATTWNASTKAGIAKLFADVTAQIAALGGSIGNLTSAQAKNTLTIVLGTLQTAAATLQALLT